MSPPYRFKECVGYSCILALPLKQVIVPKTIDISISISSIDFRRFNNLQSESSNDQDGESNEFDYGTKPISRQDLPNNDLVANQYWSLPESRSSEQVRWRVNVEPSRLTSVALLIAKSIRPSSSLKGKERYHSLEDDPQSVDRYFTSAEK